MKFTYEVEGNEFIDAGIASSKFKTSLKQLGIPSNVIRKIAIAMYEAEINMVIHANGGEITAEVTPKNIYVRLEDQGPGIADIELAMKAGYSTASEQARTMGFGAGMGLPNIKRYSDHLTVHSEVNVGTIIEISFDI